MTQATKSNYLTKAGGSAIGGCIAVCMTVLLAVCLGACSSFTPDEENHALGGQRAAKAQEITDTVNNRMLTEDRVDESLLRIAMAKLQLQEGALLPS